MIADKPGSATAGSGWKGLYRAAALAPLVALVRYPSQFFLLMFGEPFPATVEGWFALAQRSRLLALWYLNALDIVSFALLAVVVFVVPRRLSLSLPPLSGLYAAADTEGQRAIHLAAGEALSQVSTATPQTAGLLLMAVAGLIMSIVILRIRSFGQVAGYVGIVAFVAALGAYALQPQSRRPSLGDSNEPEECSL